MEDNKNLFKKEKSIKGILVGILILCAVIVLCALGIKMIKSSNKEVNCVDDLPGSKIGVQLGTTGDIYATDYEEYDDTEVVRYNKGADAIQALKQGKVDCVIIDEQPAIAFVDKNPSLSILEEEFALEDYAICVSKDNKVLTEDINNALAQLKAEGVLDNIINYYINNEDGSIERYESPEGIKRDNGKLVVASNLEFPPYEYIEDGKPKGVDMDLVQAIADKLGMEIEIDDMQFDSVIVAVQSKKATIGISGMTVTEERKKNIDFTDSYTTAKQVIIVKTGEDSEVLSLKEKVKQTFVTDGRWKYIVKGLGNTLIITILAGMAGIILGFLLAVIRTAYDRADNRGIILKIINGIAKVYLTIFRGTPMMVQLLIMYYVIFASVNISPIVAAVIAFGLNSGAYVAEAVRAGIISIPTGQFEAGRSLGFSYTYTMWYIILPQALKNALPAMCNEFIALLKESSIVGYIGLMDLTKAGDIIRSNTYEAMVPLISVALVYLVIVMILTGLVGRLERRLKNGE